MTNGKAIKTPAKGQKAITSFFGGSKKPKDNNESSDADVDASESEEEAMEVDDAPIRKKANKSGKTGAPDTSDFPPINDIASMFADIVSHIPQIASVVERIKGRKLRVATMCSGTESPLLALDLICKAITKQHGIDLDVEHVFSCEIEPFKQAYIERNFHPPLLFRDVCELGNSEATTAYGSKAPVPGDVDILVAGTSCVDYSNLNNEKQDLDANGESGRTFRGMMSWVKNHRPPLVILENVCGAPWERVRTYFEKNGYSATYLRVDTKQYYIPHTRTRVYLLAVHQRKSQIPDTWKDWVGSKLKRAASSTLDAFLLPSDDPRIHQARQKLVQESFNGVDRRTGRTDWGRCESRHQRARLEEELGLKRPLTSWDEGGYCKLPDFAWGDWGIGQVERVWDLMDISLLRSAKKGVDPSFKTQVWNLSQNVDRTIGSNKVGICPCLTPSMIPYITNRGGPMVGLEALSMQGLPVDQLLLTRETEDQLADLAGNAMSTTVVGACILAALVVGKKLLKAGDDCESYEVKDGQIPEDEPEKKDDIMDVDETFQRVTTLEDRVVGEDKLIEKPLDLSITNERSLPDLLVDADKSARLCECEGRADITDRELLLCQDCGTSSCKKCGGRPEHNPVPIDVVANPRLSPTAFAKELKSTLPMCISLSNITQQLLDDLKEKAHVVIPKELWRGWTSAVLRAAKFELRFVEPKRQEIWTAVYQSPAASLDLHLHPKQPEWRLYAKPEESEPANSDIRELLEFPVGRLTCVDGLLNGRWEFALPRSEEMPLQIQGVGHLVPSWEARLGLMGDEFKDSSVYSQVKITIPDKENSKLDRDISGVYTLLDKCGTANGALHRKESTEAEKSLPPLFMLLDPHRCKDSEDAFVFSISKRRYEYGESRPIICRLDPKWRQSSDADVQDITCHLPCTWVQAETVELKPSHGQDSRFSVPGQVLDVAVTQDACCSANAVLVCSVPLRDQAGPEWPRGTWQEVDNVHERTIFKSLAWLLERIRHVDDHFSSWQTLEMPEEQSNCERCAPSTPAVTWRKVNKKDVPFENTIQAGEYERSLKRRPSPFVTQLKLDESGTGTVRIGINIPSLVHRALSRLPSKNRTEVPTISWRLNTDFTPIAKLHLPKFVIASNKLDKEHDQPPSFKIPLRKEQLRSLEWMLKREARDAALFIEEEISEAILGPLGWRAEGRAQRPVRIRGGVLADQVGYGKTAITLGLIDCARKNVAKEFAMMGRVKGKIGTQATAIIVPPHLTKQWNSEGQKFAGRRFKTVVLSTATSLNSLTIEAVQDADLVVIASNLFRSTVYLANLESLAATGPLPPQDGRYFNAKLHSTLTKLRTQTDLLQDEGSVAVMKNIREGRRKQEEEAAAEAEAVPTKRLKGKSYRDAAEKDSSKQSNASSSWTPPSGLIMEVVIPVRKDAKIPKKIVESLSSSAAEESEEDGVNSDVPRPTKQRAAARKVVITISDDENDVGSASEYEEDEGDDAPIKNTSTSHGRSKADPPPSSSDFDDTSLGETVSDDDVSDNISDGEESLPKSKSKSKAKGKAKTQPKAKPPTKKVGKKSQTESTTDEDDMEVDEPASKGKKTPKRKADEDKRPAKKQKRREDTDPWKLESAAVKRDWTQMQAPPLEMFHFARVVVDEYTYLDGKAHALVTNLSAERHWVLSGTPPIHDFGALKTIAAFLDVHLGIDDDAEGQSAQVKKRRRDQTAVEKFHSFREVHSLEWHAHRHALGQLFLDHFVRQNIAEIDEIPWTEKKMEIILPAAERAIYLELEHHLRALDMTIKRGKKNESDREKRLAKALGESQSAEEALLKRCSHFDLETSNDNAMKACDVIVQERQKQLDECKEELLQSLLDGVKRESKISGRTGEESLFQEYVRVSTTEGVGDKEASAVVVGLLDEAKVAKPSKSAPNGKNKNKDEDIPTKIKDLVWEHREKTHEIRRLTKELVGRVRSLRYFTVVRDLQKHRDSPPVVPCPGCERDSIPIEEVAVLSSCGHTGCLKCVKDCAVKEECVYAASGSCKSAARLLNVVEATSLGVDDEDREGRGKHFGMKLEKVVSLIKRELPKDERVLIFVQFGDLMKKLVEALTASKIKFLEIKGTATQKSNNLEKFQNDSPERVLLLTVTDESASGANLTSANHAIFLSPLLSPSKEIYQACETQAVGRLVRYGQTKHVYVYRFLTRDTIDMEIFDQRTKELKSQ